MYLSKIQKMVKVRLHKIWAWSRFDAPTLFVIKAESQKSLHLNLESSLLLSICAVSSLQISVLWNPLHSAFEFSIKKILGKSNGRRGKLFSVAYCCRGVWERLISHAQLWLAIRVDLGYIIMKVKWLPWNPGCFILIASFDCSGYF